MRRRLQIRALYSDPVRRLVGAEFASLLGDFMVLAAIPFAVRAVGGTAGDVGIVAAAQGAGVALFLPLGGILGDRFRRRNVMVCADVLRFASQACIAAALLSGDGTLWLLVVAQAVHGVGTAIFMPASAAIVPDAIHPESLQGTNGLKGVGRAAAGTLGPAAGAVAVAAAGPGAAMAADAATFLASASLLAGLSCRTSTKRSTSRERRGVAARPSPYAGTARKVGAEVCALQRQVHESVSAFRAMPWLWTITIEFTLINALVLAPFYVFGPALSQDTFGGPKGWALMLTALAPGEFLGGLTAMKWQVKRPLVIATGAFASWAMPLALLAAGMPLTMILLALFGAGVGSATFAVLWETTLQTHVPSAQLSRISAVEQCGSLAVVPFGFLLAGWLEQTIGATLGLGLGAALLMVLTFVVLSRRCVRGVRSADFRQRRQSLTNAQRPQFATGGESL